jgi:hypothetical protein
MAFDALAQVQRGNAFLSDEWSQCYENYQRVRTSISQGCITEIRAIILLGLICGCGLSAKVVTESSKRSKEKVEMLIKILPDAFHIYGKGLRGDKSACLSPITGSDRKYSDLESFVSQVRYEYHTLTGMMSALRHDPKYVAHVLVDNPNAQIARSAEKTLNLEHPYDPHRHLRSRAT